MDPLRFGCVELVYAIKDSILCPEKVEMSHKGSKIIGRKQKQRNTSDNSEDSADETEKEGETDSEDEPEEKKRKGEYEVEKIIDRCDFGNGEVFYLVKWKYWQHKYNTWEPAEHLDCTKRLVKYLKRVVYRSGENLISRVIESLAQPTKENLEKFMASLQRMQERITMTVRSESKLRRMACSVQRCAKKKRQLSEKRLQQALLLKYLFVRRSRQMVSLNEWKDEMNRLSNDPADIEVSNDFDLEGPPDNFFYINQYIPGSNVTIPDDPPVGCRCRKCDLKSPCCSSLAKFKFAYNSQGLLRVSPNMPIYECNKRCQCKSNCPNRVVQNGRKFKLCIFRTSDNRGWGVKALEDIRKGSYICTYLGEVIDNTEAEMRIEKYQSNRDTYLFDMDYNGANYRYTVDATDYGTISRFVNHSCRPNITVCFVWIDCLDPNLPLLAFFATDFIAEGQELTIDYVGDLSKIDATIIRKTKPCRCGNEKCKKVVF